jgi:RimJ/RimL family protein N-acetyltransferase
MTTAIPIMERRARGVRVRIGRHEDELDLVRARGNPVFWREVGFRSVDAYEHHISGLFEDETWSVEAFPFVIEFSGDGRPDGFASLQRTGPALGHGVGGLFRPDDRGRGRASIAMALALDISFRDIGVDHVSSTVWPDNPGALRFWMRLGFRAEGWQTVRQPAEGLPDVEILVGATAQEFRESPVAAEIFR